jgi:hypothetical protein
MVLFDYVMLLVSVVLSLGLARLLETHARLLKRRGQVRWSAVYLAWFAILASMHVDLWATLWSVHSSPHWPWTAVLGFLFQGIALFYGSVLIAPEADEHETVDLWQFHQENRRRYVSALIVYTLLGFGLSMIFLPVAEQFNSATLAISLQFISLCALAMLVSPRWLQRVVAAVAVAWVLWYFVRYLPEFSA